MERKLNRIGSSIQRLIGALRLYLSAMRNVHDLPLVKVSLSADNYGFEEDAKDEVNQHNLLQVC